MILHSITDSTVISADLLFDDDLPMCESYRLVHCSGMYQFTGNSAEGISRCILLKGCLNALRSHTVIDYQRNSFCNQLERLLLFQFYNSSCLLYTSDAADE